MPTPEQNRLKCRKWRKTEKGKASARRRDEKYRATEKGKACQRRSSKKWREKNKERVRATDKLWKAKNKERVKAARNAWLARNPERRLAIEKRYYDKNVRRILERKFERTYGMPRSSWEALFDAQGRACAICRSTVPRSRSGWCTDHDHATGAVRGILCHRCNTGLGSLGDSIGGIRTALDYLLRSVTVPRVA